MNAPTKIAGSRKAGSAATAVTSHDVLIIGAGFSGIGMAIKLLECGITDFAVLERAGDVGGTWRDNTYPGAACDIPSNLYSYSFAPNPDWSSSYPAGGEILKYVHRIVDDYHLRRFIRFGRNVSDMTYDESAGRWQVCTTGSETFDARVVVMASGPLANASLPAIRGIETFEGHKIHSAKWDHGYDFRGKRVAVVGTGASAIQIVPELVQQAQTLKVFQRTPPWILPRADIATPDWNRELFRQVPAAQSVMRGALYWGHEAMATALVWKTPLTRVVERMALAHLHRQVKDPWLRRQMTPHYRIGCKRVLISNEYYPALQRDNCKLVFWPIANISPQGIRTAEGIEHQFDCIVFATGFEVGKAGTPFPVYGVDGRELGESWKQGAQAYKSISVAGWPNLFLLPGPNSGPGHNSYLVYMEAQLGYALAGVRAILDGNLRSLDVRADVQAAWNRRIQKRLAGTTWNSGCSSWYLTADGYNATMFPGFATQYRQQMAALDLQAYFRIPARGCCRSPA